jgi:hypothetical protein
VTKLFVKQIDDFPFASTQRTRCQNGSSNSQLLHGSLRLFPEIPIYQLHQLLAVNQRALALIEHPASVEDLVLPFDLVMQPAALFVFAATGSSA